MRHKTLYDTLVYFRSKTPWLSLVFVILALFTLWLDGARRPYLADDFSYSSDVLGTDNFYDSASQRFSGARYTKTQLSYQFNSNHDGSGVVHSVIDTKSVQGDPVATISRDRTASAGNGRYKGLSDDEYVFAPRMLKPGQSFTTRHVTYDVPAHMVYQDTEDLFGLRVYRYKADFGSVGRIEQKEVPIAGVAKGQKLGYQPNLQYWIEPETGWLVKYHEETQVYLFDARTGERGAPFNQFDSVVTEASVRQHVAYARTLKYQQTFARQTAPGLIVTILILLAFILVLRRTGTAILPATALPGLVAAMVVVVIGGWVLRNASMVRLFIDTVGLNPLAALCFALIAVCLLQFYMRRRYMPIFLAGIVAVVGGVQLLGAAGAIPFRIDQLLFRSAIEQINPEFTSRISLSTAFLLLVMASGLCVVALSRRAAAIRFAKSAAGITVTAGVLGLLMKFSQIDTAFQLKFFTPISAVAASLFIVSGFSFLMVLQHIKGRPEDIVTGFKLLVRPALATLPLVAITIFAQMQQHSVGQKLEAKFDETAATVQNAIQSNIQTQANLIAGGRALFVVSPSVGPDDWHNYISALNTSKDYPSIQTIGYAKALTQASVSSFEDSINRTDPNFSVFPVGHRDTYVPYVYTEPHSPSNDRLVGLDLYNDNVQSETLDRARDNGLINISGKLPLASTTTTGSRTDFLMLAAVYRKGLPASNIAERRAALDGFVVASFNARSFMQHALKAVPTDVDVEVFNGLATDTTSSLYDRYNDSQTLGSNPARLTESVVVYVENHPWTVRLKALPAFRLSNTEERLPMLVLVGGALAYFFVFISLYSVFASGPRQHRTSQSDPTSKGQLGAARVKK